MTVEREQASSGATIGELVLASRSPQRRAILERAGLSFEARPSDVDELAAGEPAAVALENARRKARAVAATLHRAGDARAVLGVDTLVALEGEIFGQPRDAEQARAFLGALAGRTHDVWSGLCVVLPDGSAREGQERTAVTFRPLDEPAIDRYVALDEWRGRAGAYAIQERGAALAQRIDGDYLNVVGLPLRRLEALLALA